MPASTTLFSSRPNALITLFGGARLSFFEGVGNRLAGLVDRIAPEAYEDETGFHLVPVPSSDSRAPHKELNCLGEHI